MSDTGDGFFSFQPEAGFNIPLPRVVLHNCHLDDSTTKHQTIRQMLSSYWLITPA